MPRLTFRIGLGALALSGLAAAACGGDSGDRALTPTQAAPSLTNTIAVQPTPTAEPGLVSGEVRSGRGLRSADGRLEVRTSGATALDVSVRIMGVAPEAPKGWVLAGPVYDISARERERTVTKLPQSFELRFKTEGPAVVMYYDGKNWVVVETEPDGDGMAVASVDHLTPYALVSPAKSMTTATPSASPAATSTPEATVSATEATAALEAVLPKYKGHQVRVSWAGGYSGAAATTFPPAVLDEVSRSAALGGSLCYGVYGGVNAAVTSSAGTANLSGSLTVLVEPRIAFPVSSTDAQEQLAAIFPGAMGMRYANVSSSASAYTYLASANGVTYVLGFVLYDGLPVAYLSVGSGSYATLARASV